MNKLFFILLGVIPCITNAQIQNLYASSQKTGYGTTVVVKDKGANDEEILNDNFNLEDYRVGDVIRITTADIEKAKVAKEAAPEKVKRSSNARIVKRGKKKSKPFFSFKRNKPKRAKKVKRYSCYRF